jgi:hypothetical protein
MTLSNRKVVENWARGIDSASKHIFSEDGFLYSYGYHFVMAVRCKDGFIVNKDRYSSTTSHHQSLVRRSVSGNVWEVEPKLFDDIRVFLKNWHVGLLDETTIEEIKTNVMVERL